MISPAIPATGAPSEGQIPSRATRNDALDFTKGSLVLFMVLYHWLNYFVPLDWDVYRYLRFITTSFIFITGFLVSNVYLAKYSPRDPRLHKRLFERGAKLLLLFTALNLAARAILSRGGGAGGVDSFLANSYAIYVTGNGRAMFDVLVPIGYSLLVAPVVLMASAVFPFALHLAAVAALALALATNGTPAASINLELVAIGLFGMVVGTLPIARVHRLLERPVLLMGAYLLYLWAIGRWNILYPLQLVGVTLTLLLLYLAGTKLECKRVFERCVINLGKYSLFAYVIHIFILQAAREGLRGIRLTGTERLWPFVVTLLLTIALVELVIRVRSRSASVDRVYRLVFA